MIGIAGVATGPLRRVPAGAKVAALLVVTATAFVLEGLVALAALGAVVALGHAVTRGPRLRFLRFLVLAGLVLLAVQWWFLGLPVAAVIVARFVVTVAAAQLLTLTTAVEELVSLVERLTAPLQRVGVDPERLGLLVGLTVAAVAALTRIAGECGEAARARGMERSVTARLVPLVVRAVRHADELGEAFAARGVGER